tara:strand:+ start:57 stop:356 length:300 start_codon:yes stop_codon:yes gene_type:complete
MGILDIFRKNKEPIDTNKSVIKVNIDPFFELMTDEEEKEMLDHFYEWITVPSHDICPDCKERHGQVKKWKEWIESGLPGSGATECGGDCYCVLDPVKKD